MSFFKRLFEPPAHRIRRELFTVVAHQLNLTPNPQMDGCKRDLQQFSTLRSSWLQETRAFSCWQSNGKLAFQLVDYGIVSAGGGWQWTVLRFVPPLPTVPDFVLTGKGWLSKAGVKLGLSTAVKLPTPPDFAQQYAVYGKNSPQLTAFLTPQRLAKLSELPLPKISSIEVKDSVLIYQQSLNFKSSNPTAFNPRQIQPEDVVQIVRQGTAVYHLLTN